MPSSATATATTAVAAAATDRVKELHVANERVSRKCSLYWPLCTFRSLSHIIHALTSIQRARDDTTHRRVDSSTVDYNTLEIYNCDWHTAEAAAAAAVIRTEF